MPKMEDDDLLPDERALLEGKPLTGDTPAAGETTETPAAAASATDADDEGGGTAAAGDGEAAAAAEGAAAAATPSEGEKKPEGEGAPVAADNEGGELDAAALEEVAGENEAPAQRPTYEQPQARDFAAEKKALRDEKGALFKKWSDGGDLSDEDYHAQVSAIDDKIETLVAEQASAATIDRLNHQAIVQEQQRALSAVAAASSKANEIDYSDEKNGKAFDQMLQAVAADPANEGKSFAEVAQAAHNALCAVRGIERKASAAPAPKADAKDGATAPAAPAAAPAAAAPAAAPAQQRPPTHTLRDMPAAGAPPIGNDVLTSLQGSDDPDAQEEMIARLPVAQRQALLRSTLPQGARR